MKHFLKYYVFILNNIIDKMFSKKILFLDTVHPCLQQELEALGYQCDLNTKAPRSEIEKIIAQYFGVVVRSRITMDKKILSLAKNLKFIARSGSGMESIDVDFAKKKGILCINSPEGNRDAVAEQALGMLLCLFNNICRANEEVRKGKWNREPNRGVELNGKTVGIIGYGNTGSAFARLLSGFEIKVLVYDKYKSGFGTKEEKGRMGKWENGGGGIYEVSLKEIFKESDILSLYIPLNAETKYLVNDIFIKKFKKNFYLLNTSRGPIVKTDDLVKNLKSGKVLGACLDVIEYEETSFESLTPSDLRHGTGRPPLHLGRGGRRPEALEYLIQSDKVILTPHIAGWTVESYRKLSMVLAEKIKRAFSPPTPRRVELSRHKP